MVRLIDIRIRTNLIDDTTATTSFGAVHILDRLYWLQILSSMPNWKRRELECKEHSSLLALV